ncbi:MAG: hypothetical protein ACLVH0_04325 [Coprococcus eutactus]
MMKALRHFLLSESGGARDFYRISGRELNRTYWDKLVNKVVLRMGSKMFLPYPILQEFTMVRS